MLFDEGLRWQSVGGACLVMCCALVTLLKSADSAGAHDGKPGACHADEGNAEDTDATGGPPLMVARQLACVNRRPPATVGEPP